MIKIENILVYGWEAAIRGMRNPMNSWDKSDSEVLEEFGYCVGKNDFELMKKLCKAGTDHRKFMRMINVTCDITAPLYWVAEHDTYKISTVRNSCSFMHKGVSKPFEINDFSVQDDRVYYLLNPIEKKIDKLIYPYDTDKFKIYELENGRKYKVFRNGKVMSCEFSYTDNYGSGRTRYFEERECIPTVDKNGYYYLNLGGRNGERWLLHRLVATMWIPITTKYNTVNHINGNKGDNSVENLEWCSRVENIKKGFDDGLYDENKLHLAYNSWKNGHTVVPPHIKFLIKKDYSGGKLASDLARKYGLTDSQIRNILFIKSCENDELFMSAYIWEKIIEQLNNLRDFYLETKDENVFQEIRQILPQGYNVRYTWQANYEVLSNIYKSRKYHRLPEWREFCKWIEELPYSELIVGV